MQALMLLAFVAASVVVVPPPADALFGFDWFGGEEDSSEIIPDPVVYSATLNTPDAPEDLRKTLLTASEMTGEDAGPVSGTVGLLSAAANEQRRLIGTLYKEGYYGGTVDVLIEGRSYEDIAVDRTFSSGVVPVTIDVEAGEPFVFGTVRIQTPDGTEIDPERFGLVPGDRARSDIIVDAGKQIVSAERAAGRPLAEVAGRDVVADHATNRLDVTLTVAPGPEAVFGRVTVEGAERMRPGFVAYYANLPVGEPYSPAAIRKARRRLLDLGVFDSVVIETADAVDPDGSIAVVITVAERKRRVIGAGVTYSNTEGGGVEAYWGHRNLFGGAESIRLEGSFARIGEGSSLEDHDYAFAVLFSKPGVFGPTTKLDARAFVLHERPDAFERQAAGAEIGIEKQFSERLSATLGFGGEWSRTQDAFGDDVAILVNTSLGAVYDTRDDELDPTTGFRLAGSVAPYYDFHDGGAFFTVTRASLSAYRALDAGNRFILAARIAGGSIFGADLADIPKSKRFFAGGGGSVRGYAYQALGPRNAANEPTGGRSFAEASLEARIRVTDKIGIVPFIDAGSVSDDMLPGGGEWFAGGGVGLRYLTPVGPLRLDVAVPFNPIGGDPNFGIYVGIGQAF